MDYRTKTCIKCGNDGKQFGWKCKDQIFYGGTYWCNTCDESFCDECGSHKLKAYDDGEGYPPNILCEDCGHWPQ